MWYIWHCTITRTSNTAMSARLHSLDHGDRSSIIEGEFLIKGNYLPSTRLELGRSRISFDERSTTLLTSPTYFRKLESNSQEFHNYLLGNTISVFFNCSAPLVISTVLKVWMDGHGWRPGTHFQYVLSSSHFLDHFEGILESVHALLFSHFKHWISIFIIAMITLHVCDASACARLINCYCHFSCVLIINPDHRGSEDLTASIDSTIIDGQLLPRCCLCDGPIVTRLL